MAVVSVRIRNQVQVSRVIGNFDFFINGTFANSDGYREHSTNTYELINGNIGYRFAPWAETRFYLALMTRSRKFPAS